MKLSIITINRNNAAGLLRTIESVASQTYIDFEYILIDGASTDGSVEVIKEFENLKIWEFENESTITKGTRLQWVSEPDAGIYNAMNKGILKAKGEYLLFLNSGDWLVDEKVIQLIMDNNNEDILIGNIYFVYNNTRVVNDYIGIYSNDNTETSISSLDLIFGVFPHNACFFKRKLFDLYGLYDESLKIVSDWKFMLDVIVFKNATTKCFRNVFVTNFDAYGVSAIEKEIYQKEREKVLNEFFPKITLLDYKNYYRLHTDEQANMKRYKEYMKLRNNKFYLFFIRTFLWIERKRK